MDDVSIRLMKNNTAGNYTFILKETVEIPKRSVKTNRRARLSHLNPIAQALLETWPRCFSTSLMLPSSKLNPSSGGGKNHLEKVVDLVIHTLGSSRPRLWKLSAQ
ncbi:hypothetical protein ACB264_04790 [Klebsiella pneumoniae]